MTDLRQRMLEELQRRNYAPSTIASYLGAVEDFACYFGRRPDRLSQQDLRKYHLHLIQERKLAVPTVVARIAALWFFFVKTLRRPYLRIDMPYPRRPARLPTVLSLEEVGRLLNSARNRYHFVILMGLRFSYPDFWRPPAHRGFRKEPESSPSCRMTNARHRCAHLPGR